MLPRAFTLYYSLMRATELLQRAERKVEKGEECQDWREKRDETQRRRKTARQEGDRRGAKETKQEKNEETRQKKTQPSAE